MPLTGDFDALDELIRAFDGARLREDVHQAVAEEVSRVAHEQWGAGQNPEGLAWPRNTSNNRFPSLARPTSEILFRTWDGGIAASADDVLRYHHPRSAMYSHLDRQVFPDDGLSRPWHDAADVAAERLFAERFGRR